VPGVGQFAAEAFAVLEASRPGFFYRSREAMEDLRDSLLGDIGAGMKVIRFASDAGVSLPQAAESPAAPKTRKRAAKPKSAPVSGLDLARLVWAAADEHKVVSPVLLDLVGLSSIADYFYVAHAETPRQIKAIAEKIASRAREAGVKPFGQEGLNQPDASWILIDLGEVIAHLFLPESRAKYDLEGFWADAPRVDPKALKKSPKVSKKARPEKAEPSKAPGGSQG
jgi:ribosome-associated protein